MSEGVRLFRIATAHPGDITGLERLVDGGELCLEQVVAVFGKTEGNGCVNDFTRGYMASTLRHFLAQRLGAEMAAGIALVMSGGTEGVLSPHITVVTRPVRPPTVRETAREGALRLSVGVARTDVVAPEALGRMAQIKAVASAVKTAMSDAGTDDPAQVHYVQIKCPLLTAASIERAAGGTVTTDTYESMAYSRGAAALGVACALGEVDPAAFDDTSVLADWDLYSKVASASAGAELDHCEVILLGNAAGAGGDLVIRHALMRDAIDGDAVRGLIAGDEAREVVQIFAKAEADPRGRIRGHRHTMIDDSDIHQTRHARAVVGGVIASVVGDSMIYVSGGAEHQGPPGGGVCAAVLRQASATGEPPARISPISAPGQGAGSLVYL
jgi:cyanuric acid amidohydrolase